MWILVFACQRPPIEVPTPRAPVTLHLAAINDFHGGLYESRVRGDATNAWGGLPWLAAAVDSVRAEHPDLILLDGGDEFQGSWPVNATFGRGSVEAFELLGVDAAALGNHEFDYGQGGGGDPRRGALEAAMSQADYPFLAANVYQQGSDERYAPANLAPWKLIERDGLRIGVVGLSTADTPTVTNPKNVDDLEFRDVVTTVAALEPELAAANLDVRVLVAHLTGGCSPQLHHRNEDACTPDAEVGRLLTELPPGTFDVMVLGHYHTVLHHRVGDTIVLENRSAGQLLGRVDLVVGPDGVDLDASTVHDPWALVHAPADPGCGGGEFPREPRDVGGTWLQPDEEAIALIERLEAEAGSLCDELGCASRALGRDASRESELGDWLADAMLARFPDAQLAIQNSGGIRAELPAGQVRRETIQRIMPFDNAALVVSMSGAKVRELLQLGVSGKHGLLQIAGARITVDRSRPPEDRLTTATVGGKPLDDAATYKVVTSDFLFSGGDSLGPAFEGATIVEQGPLLRDVFYDAAANTEGCIGDRPILDPKNPRITLVGTEKK